MKTKTDGLLLDRYKIISKLGRGGFSDVYKAFDTRMERVVAIKEVHIGRHSPEKVLREARTVALLNHPNIVTIHEFEEDDESCYLIMELLEGLTLSKILSKISPLEKDEALVIAIEICRALEAAHNHGIIHRDIKPGNVMVLYDGRIKVMDFGIARLKGIASTTSGNIIGTFVYMSPEQTRGELVDERSDIYSLGTVLYQMLTDVIPFSGESVAETIKLVQTAEPHPPSLINPKLNNQIDDCILKALAKNPLARFHSVASFRRTLENLRSETTRSERVLQNLIERYVELDDELAWAEDLSFRGKLWHFIEERGLAIARTAIAVTLSYPFFKMPEKVFGIFGDLSFIIALAIYFSVLLRPDYGIGLALLMLSLSLIKYSLGLFLLVIPFLIPFWMLIVRRWPLLSISPSSGAIFGALNIPFVLPVICGLLLSPITASVISFSSCLVFEILNVFLSKSTSPGIINAFNVWENIKNVANPIIVAREITMPFVKNPFLLIQPVLWAGTSAITSLTNGGRRWFAAIFTGALVLFGGYQAILSHTKWHNLNIFNLMQSFSFSLIILLLLSIFRPPVVGLEENDETDDELTTTTGILE